MIRAVQPIPLVHRPHVHRPHVHRRLHLGIALAIILHASLHHALLVAILVVASHFPSLFVHLALPLLSFRLQAAILKTQEAKQ